MENIKKYKLTEDQMKLVTRVQKNALSNNKTIMEEFESENNDVNHIEKMIGEPEDRRVEYPSPGDLEAIKTGQNMDKDGTTGEEEIIDPKDMKSPPHELLSYLDKIEEAKSILSRVAAKEDNENIKNRIYAHYEKAQKLAFEMIKEFGIVH
jgi:hypothetical protein